MKLTQRFTLVVPLGTGNFNPSIARTVVTFWPGQVPNVQGVGIVFSADEVCQFR
jgi:hypothetical protein